MRCLPSIATLLRSQCSTEDRVAGDSPPLILGFCFSLSLLTAQDCLLRSVHVNTADKELYLQGGDLLKKPTSLERGGLSLGRALQHHSCVARSPALPSGGLNSGLKGRERGWAETLRFF